MRSNEIDPPVLVVGYGNELRGDDGVGPAAAEALRDRLPRQIAEVLAVQQLLPELIERINRSRVVIFIDADANAPPGQIRQEKLTAHRASGEAIGHYQSPESLLAMACELYGHAPSAILFHVGAANFDFKEGLSEPVREAILRLVREVIEIATRAVWAEERHYA